MAVFNIVTLTINFQESANCAKSLLHTMFPRASAIVCIDSLLNDHCDNGPHQRGPLSGPLNGRTFWWMFWLTHPQQESRPPAFQWKHTQDSSPTHFRTCCSDIKRQYMSEERKNEGWKNSISTKRGVFPAPCSTSINPGITGIMQLQQFIPCAKVYSRSRQISSYRGLFQPRYFPFPLKCQVILKLLASATCVFYWSFSCVVTSL